MTNTPLLNAMAQSMRIGSTALVLGSLMITSTAVLADERPRKSFFNRCMVTSSTA